MKFSKDWSFETLGKRDELISLHVEFVPGCEDGSNGTETK